MGTNRKRVASLTFRHLFNLLLDLATNPSKIWFSTIVILLAELVLNIFIIRRVAYTEIDWKAYMEQLEMISSGERDYLKIKGGTGPLVYPAMHVYIFYVLKKLTDEGTNLVRAQWIFMGLYLLNTFVVMKIYEKIGRVKPWLLYFMFIASQRIHSIYVLRLFNDPVAMILMHVCILALVSRRWAWSTIFFTFALNTKMNIRTFSKLKRSIF